MKKIILLTIIMILSINILSTSSAGAVSAADWKAGRIIDDAVFANKDDMTVAEIQTFLNNRVGTGSNGVSGRCDTNGTKASELGGGTRAQYGAAHGNPAPFTCLKDYYEVPKLAPGPGMPASNYGGVAIPSGAKSAAQLIWDAAQRYNISSRVLLIKLQTESAGPLTTDDWPFLRQYNFAMGAHCPDSGPEGSANCDVNYAGFSIQISESAALLRYYLDNMTKSWWSYKKPYQNNNIMWNVVERGCGASNVYIETKATAALYTYTPYQPNQAALNNMYGTGDGCSAYGNRNFWRTYNDWFGSTQGSVQITSPLNITTEYTQGSFINQNVVASFTIQNTTSQQQDIGTMAITVRDSSGNNLDFGNKYIIIAPHSTYRYSEMRTFSSEATLTFGITNLRTNFGWNDNYPESTNSYPRTVASKKIQKIPAIIESPAAANELRVGKSTALTFKVKNGSSAYAANLGRIGLALRGPAGSVADLPFESIPTLGVGATYAYTKPFIPEVAGRYTAYISSTGDNGVTWNENGFPAIESDSIQRRVNLDVKPSPTQTASVSFGSSPIRVGKAATGSFTIRNYGNSNVDVGSLAIAVRGPGGINADLPLTSVTALAEQDYVYNFSQTFTQPGTYTAWITNYRNGVWDDTTYPVSENESVLRKITFEVKPNPTLTVSPSVSTAGTARVGLSSTATFTLHNYGDTDVSIGSLAVAVRGPNGENGDFDLKPVTIPAGGDYVYTSAKTFDRVGYYSAWITNLRNGVWDDTTYPQRESDDIIRRFTFEVKASPTITQGFQSSITELRTGNTSTISFKVKNYTASPVDIGKIGLAGRDPIGRNVDPGVVSVVLSAGEERTINYVITPTMTGNYTYSIISTGNNGVSWQTGPAVESSTILKNLTINVRP